MKSFAAVSRRGLGVASSIFGLVCLLAASAGAQEKTPGWVEDGSEPHVKEVVEQADSMLHPAAPVAPSHGSLDATQVPSLLGSSYPELDVPNPPWRYDTQYFFGLSRGLFHEDISGAVKGVSLIGTVPLDLTGLPIAVCAGLFGS